jgi:hypothetical protein
MQVDLTNYHSLGNRFLTNSRIGDWLKCKRFFFERHISGQRSGIVMTDALRVGSAVDTFMFFGEEAFANKFVAAKRRNLKNPLLNVIELTEKQFQDVFDMCEVLLRQPAVKDLALYDRQTIMTADMPIGNHFCGLACIPDWIKIDGDTCYIVDLKTAYDPSEHKYHYKCLDLGYYRQFAVMKLVVEANHPEVKKFTYRHVGVEKDKDSIFNPFAFYLANEQVDFFANQIVNEIVPAIAEEKDFLPNEVSWDKAPTIGNIEDDF